MKATRVCRRLRCLSRLAALPFISLVCGLTFAGPADRVEFLSDHPELLLRATQAWGVLGIDVAAHAPDQPGEPLRIADKPFAKGLGHHANGTIEVLLDGEFTSFEAEVGLQPCGGGGSVVFRVLVDGEVRFDSGVMRTSDSAKSLQVSVAGAQELTLEANDAGDGITCDMANWAGARLIRSGSAVAAPAEPPVDVAPFGRVVTWDPNRMEGARASRIEEFPAADLFLETDLHAETDGNFAVPVSTNGLACIGVQWLNRRAVKELSLGFVDATRLPATNEVRMEGWFGESAWQGRWLPLAGDLQRTNAALVFRAAAKSPAGGLLLTRKVRWVWPAAGERTLVRRPTVFTRSRWATARLLVQFETPRRVPEGFNAGKRVFAGKLIEVFNGEFTEPPAITWEESRPQPLTVRYSRASSLKSDPTHLVLALPWERVAVAVQDILDNDGVYLPDFGAFFCRADQPISLAEYKARIAGRKTILEQVRGLPDQTLAQAMAKTHHDAQSDGPVMLSLACDNTKFVVERDGTVRFRTTPDTTTEWFKSAGALDVRFEDSPKETLTRWLDGGWLPIPVIRREHDGVILSQRTFVAPCDEDGADPTRLNRLSIGVVQLSLSGVIRGDVAPLRLSFQAVTPVTFEPAAYGFLAKQDGHPFAVVVRSNSEAKLPAVAGASLVFDSEAVQSAADRWVVYLLPPEFPSAKIASLPAVEELRAGVERYWEAVLAPAMQIETPEPFLNNLIRSSQVRCLIAARNEASGARIAPWIAAMSYGPLESEAHSVIRGMDFLGHHEFARRGLEYFIHRYNTNGFLTTGYTTFGTAWHLWTLGEHYELTRDASWLRRVAPEIKRVGRWIISQTEKTKRGPAPGFTDVDAETVWARRPSKPFLAPGCLPESGLMPPGVMADWNAFAYHFCLNGYYTAALRHLGSALSSLGDPEAARFLQAAQDLSRDTTGSFALTRAASPAVPLRDGTWVAYYPSQVHSPGKLADFFPGEDAGRSWCYDVELGAHQLVPAGVLDPFDDAMEPMLNHMEDVQFLADGWFDYPASENERDWFNLGGFSKVQPYYCRNCEIYALRDDVKPFVRSYFNTLAAMVNPEVMTFWEHFHHSGAWDKTHETGYFLHQTRTMLVQERGVELWLAPMITSNWLQDGMAVAVTNAPTRFGKVGYHLASRIARGQVEADIEPPTELPLLRIVLRLRHPEGHPITSVTVNGTRHDDFDPQRNLVRLPPNRGRLRVIASFAPDSN